MSSAAGDPRYRGLLVDYGGVLTTSLFASFGAFCESEGLDPQALALGYAMLMFVACLMAGLRWQMIENGTRLVLSQIQIHASGYYPNRSIQKTFGGRKGADKKIR